MKRFCTRLLSLLALVASVATPLGAQVPTTLHYQGRIAVDGVNFDGTGQFKFVLLGASDEFLWSHDGTALDAFEPYSSVSLPVTKGLYAVALGDPAVPMEAVPAAVFARGPVRLRVWFDDGVHGFQQLTPDQPIASAGTALLAASVVDGAITASALVPGILPMPVSTSEPSVAAERQVSYSATSGSRQEFLLPAGASVGDVVEIRGVGAGGWSAGAWLPRLNDSNWRALAVSGDGSRLFAGAYNGQLLRSTDGGLNWTAASEPDRYWQSIASSTDGQRLVATTYFAPTGSIYTSADGGATWTPRSVPTSAIWMRTCASSADGSVLLVGSDGFNTGDYLYVSTDGGLTWSPRMSDQQRRWTSVAMSASGTKMVAVDRSFSGGGGGQIYTSTDGGATWTPRESNRLWMGVASSADGNKLAAVADGGKIYTSTDAGLTWTPREEDRSWRGIASSADGQKLVAVAADQLVFVSNDGGAIWIPQVSVKDWGAVAMSNDGRRALAAAEGDPVLVADFILGGGQGTTGTVQFLGDRWVAVGQSTVAAGAVGRAQLTAGAVGTAQLASGAVTNAQLANGAVGSAQLAAGAVGSAQLAAGAVGTAQLASAAVTGANLAASAVNTAALANGAVTTAKLANGAVTGAQIAAGGVGAANLATGAVGTGQLAAGAVDANALGNGAVTTAKLATGAVDANALGNGAVTSAKLGAGAVTSAKLGSDLSLAGQVRFEGQGLFVGNAFIDGDSLNDGTSLTPGLAFGAGATEGIASKRNAGTGQRNLAFYTNGAARLTILNNGNVGVGTANPTLARLQISGAVTSSLAYGYLNGAGAVGTVGANNVPLSVHASDRIAATEFNAYSDARIKTVLGLSDTARDLRTLQQIEITDYRFRDQLARGDGVQKKVVAQQVERVFPQAVKRLTDVVPDIYRAATLREGWIELATDLRVGERVKLIAAEAQEICEVLEVRPGAFRTALANSADGRVFVYGREVSDFRTVDYEAISMLNVAATQELARKVAENELEMNVLRRQLAELRAAVARPVRAAKAVARR